ncbi:hypothetical protein CDAR_614281 [Caerostris darwini]|uniref:Uncharacterized protein n=1 Tax=Caerostris darwini TaxID=1538125 RepID=A0AAV4MCP2_9ARAC|nr:hypothetical protein CDAR_614281 [Caerostris darwini]
MHLRVLMCHEGAYSNIESCLLPNQHSNIENCQMQSSATSVVFNFRINTEAFSNIGYCWIPNQHRSLQQYQKLPAFKSTQRPSATSKVASCINTEAFSNVGSCNFRIN